MQMMFNATNGTFNLKTLLLPAIFCLLFANELSSSKDASPFITKTFVKGELMN